MQAHARFQVKGIDGLLCSTRIFLMKYSSQISSQQMKRTLLLTFVLPVLFLILPGNLIATELPKTLFLPLKIVTLSSETSLTSQADKALAQAVKDKGFALLERGKANRVFDYQREWPPAPATITKIDLLADYDLLVAGNLTVIGSQISLDLKLFDLLSPNQSQYFTAEGKGLEELGALCKTVVGKIASFADRETKIASIAPAGNKKIDSGAILQNIQTKSGDLYDPENLKKDLRSIFKMGWFDDVQIEMNQGINGKDIVFRVIEKPVIQTIEYSGIDELDDKKVKDVVTIKEQSILNPAEVNKAADAIQLLYKSKGYYNTTVTPEITFPTSDTAKILFKIDEGEKIYIKKIAFQGNATFDGDELEDEIETDTKGFFSWITDSGLLDYDKLNQDTGRITNFYGNHGFLETKIGDPIVKQENEWLYITFIIEEGTRFKVGKIDIEGDLLDSKETMLKMISLRKEKYISRKILREDILKISDFYAEKGYANADIRPKIDKVDDDTLNITINISKKELVYINRINITGNTRTRDNVIRRELKVEEGGIFNAKAIRDSVQKLQYLAYFDEVNVTPEKSFNDSTVDVNIEVKDKSTGAFTIGAGYSSVDHLLFMGEIAENNFLGRGDTLSLSAALGGSSSKYNLKYKNPHVYDSQLSWGFDLFDTQREYDDYTKDSTGGSFSLGYPVWEQWRAYGTYGYTDTTLSDVDDDASYIIRNSQDIHITSEFTISLLRDSRNRQFGASKGSRNTISVEYAGGPMGGDSEFTKIQATSSWYFPLFWNSVFHVKGSAGQAFENETDKLPVYERFYLGGLRSIRGFDYGKVSPKDPDTDERIGGDKMWFTNFEYIFPLATDSGVNGVIFFDMGNVYNDDEDWDFSDYKKSVGFGIRWFSPLGPLRLEWGYNLDPLEDEDNQVWDFTIGGVF